MIAVGSAAPDFTLPDESGKKISLSGFKGKPVLLIFYPGDETPVCTKQLCSYRDGYEELQKRGVAMFAVSTDSVASHQAFKAHHGFPFPLLSDSEKKVSKLYDALSVFGVSQRAYILIDAQGIVRLSESEFLPLFYKDFNQLIAQLDATATAK